MHFVTGGAFNGKSAWIKAYHDLSEENSCWFSSYHGGSFLPQKWETVEKRVVVLEGIELWVKELLKNLDTDSVREYWQAFLEKWLQWENRGEGRCVILIGSDMMKGIVPADPGERIWRDVTGRVFQDTVAACERVDVVWYGIGRRLK